MHIAALIRSATQRSRGDAVRMKGLALDRTSSLLKLSHDSRVGPERAYGTARRMQVFASKARRYYASGQDATALARRSPPVAPPIIAKSKRAPASLCDHSVGNPSDAGGSRDVIAEGISGPRASIDKLLICGVGSEKTEARKVKVSWWASVADWKAAALASEVARAWSRDKGGMNAARAIEHTFSAELVPEKTEAIARRAGGAALKPLGGTGMTRLVLIRIQESPRHCGSVQHMLSAPNWFPTEARAGRKKRVAARKAEGFLMGQRRCLEEQRRWRRPLARHTE
jgi:hypothetical protein